MYAKELLWHAATVVALVVMVAWCALSFRSLHSSPTNRTRRATRGSG